VCWLPTHGTTPFLKEQVTRHGPIGNGEPLRNQRCGTSDIETFNLGDELKRAATAGAIAEAVPSASMKIDHELPAIAATMNGTTTG